ncbi:unnamed protein product [Protopolystoma xenopodis]|uniref:Uncharacterized protein n=1 Tax=Protopolystoma xenopodis TaxID=117903 RepID=A0A448WQY9_9PLAT|nr:unnamed protein product [Protopolystoma xenopodis]
MDLLMKDYGLELPEIGSCDVMCIGTKRVGRRLQIHFVLVLFDLTQDDLSFGSREDETSFAWLYNLMESFGIEAEVNNSDWDEPASGPPSPYTSKAKRGPRQIDVVGHIVSTGYKENIVMSLY